MKRKALNGEPITAKKMGTQKSKSQKQTSKERALGKEGMSQKNGGLSSTLGNGERKKMMKSEDGELLDVGGR